MKNKYNFNKHEYNKPQAKVETKVVEIEYYFPEYSITISAQSQDEALKKLKLILENKKKGGEK